MDRTRTIATWGLLALGLLVLPVPGPVTAGDPEGLGALLKKHGLCLLDGEYSRYRGQTQLHATADTSIEVHLMSKAAPLSKEEVPRVVARIREYFEEWPHWEALQHVMVVFHEPGEGGAWPRRAQLWDIYTYAWVGSRILDDGTWTWGGKWRGEDLAPPGQAEK